MNMTHKLSREDQAEIRGFKNGRLMAFTEMWEEFRDAPGGPMMDAMKMVHKKMEETEHGGDSRSGN